MKKYISASLGVLAAVAIAGAASAQAAKPAGAPAAAPAAADGPKFCVVDRGGVLQASAASKSFKSQMDVLQARAAAPFAAEDDWLQKEDQYFGTIDPNTPMTEALNARFNTFKTRLTAQQAKKKPVADQITQTVKVQGEKTEKALLTSINEIANEQHCIMVFEKGAVIAAVSQFYIDEAVLNRLNQKLPSLGAFNLEQVPAAGRPAAAGPRPATAAPAKPAAAPAKKN